MLQNDLGIERIEVLLDMQTKKLQAELSAIREELSRVKEELAKKQDAPAPRVEAPVQQVAPPVAEPAAAPQFQPTPTAAPQQAAAAPAEQPIDRNGVAPEEVSIEKIFYVGG